jgi:hypothetical protein
VSRHLFEQLKHFLTASDEQADKFGANSIANLLASSAADVVSAVEGLAVGGNETLVSEAAGIYQENITQTGLQGDIDDELDTHTLRLSSIETNTSWIETVDNTLQTDVRTDLKRGRTNLAGKQLSKNYNTSSGSASAAVGTQGGCRLRHVVLSWEPDGADAQFRLTLGGQKFLHVWLAKNGENSPMHVRLGEFYVSASGNPTFGISRLSGTIELTVDLFYEDLAEDNSGYPTS